MTQQDEWGPWIEHDGSGFPGPVGGFFQVQINRGDKWQGISVGKYNEHGSAWDWSSVDDEFWWKIVIRYRVRKPRALLDMIERIENMPAPEKQVTHD